MKRLAFTIDAETQAALKELAAADKESVSHYLRMLIRQRYDDERESGRLTEKRNQRLSNIGHQPANTDNPELGRLIAAAPDLLEALKFMLEHREFQLQMAGTTRKSKDIEMAKAAIAKAENHDAPALDIEEKGE